MEHGLLDVAEAQGPAPFAAVREEWCALLERSPQATVYQTWEWNDAWWRVFGTHRRLRLVCVRRGGELLGIAPLYVSRHLNTPLRRLAFVGTGMSDYLDVLAADGHQADVVRALLSYLADARDFDLADLQQLAPSSALRCELPAGPVAGRRKMRTALVAQEPCPYVELPGDWSSFVARLGKKMRSNVAYYGRLLARTFPDAVTCQAGHAERDEVMDALFRLHQRRWNQRMLPGVLGGTKVRAFHRIVADRFAENDWLRLHCTRANGAVVAVLYCFQYRGRTYYYLGGFEPDLARYSLGTVLTAHAVQQAIAEGSAEFDFLRGHEPYKYRWQPTDRVNERLLAYRKGCVRGGALLHVNRVERFVERRAKEFAETRGRKGPA